MSVCILRNHKLYFYHWFPTAASPNSCGGEPFTLTTTHFGGPVQLQQGLPRHPAMLNGSRIRHRPSGASHSSSMVTKSLRMFWPSLA